MRIERAVLHILLVVVLLAGYSGSVAAGNRLTSALITFVPGTAEPRIVLTLGTNPALLIAKPRASDFKAMMAYQQKVLAYADWDDPRVEITMPMIEYDRATTVGNAMISKGLGVSFDPSYFAATNKIRHIGQVTIVEFTEDVIRGRYSAALFSVKGPKQPQSEGSVSGWFTIGFPGRHDPRNENDLSESELIRLTLATMWDTLRGAGFALDDAAKFQESRGGGGDGSGGAQGGVLKAPEPPCVCECDMLMTLPEDHRCIQAGGQCYQDLKSCKQFSLGPAPEPQVDDLDQLIALMLGKNAPKEAVAALRQQYGSMPPKELAKMLEWFRKSAAQK